MEIALVNPYFDYPCWFRQPLASGVRFPGEKQLAHARIYRFHPRQDYIGDRAGEGGVNTKVLRWPHRFFLVAAARQRACHKYLVLKRSKARMTAINPSISATLKPGCQTCRLSSIQVCPASTSR